MDQHIDAVFDPETFETVLESPVAYITRARFRENPNGTPGSVVAIKSASTLLEFSKEPHDIMKELRILSSIYHPNVIQVLGRSFDHAISSLNFWMPFVPYSLSELMDCPTFSPYLAPGAESSTISPSHQVMRFTTLARSIIYQLISAVVYLHDPSRGIAHRDIKPRNILLGADCCVKLIDFGIAWNKSIASSLENLWPEPSENLCFDICTGPYRAPELIFGPRNYDPFAVDLWCLGTTCAEFFTSLRLAHNWDDSDSEGGSIVEDNYNKPKKPFAIPDNYAPHGHGANISWYRDTLFDSTRGTICLAWSIFRIRGTPTKENWPTFATLPDAGKVSFEDVPPVDLGKHLPNLPPGDHPLCIGSHFPPEVLSSSPLDLIHRFLVYPENRRLRASDALHHAWLSKKLILLPEGYPVEQAGEHSRAWENQTLGDLLLAHLSPRPVE